MNFYLDAWRNFANFSGRATRQQYWMFVLINIIVAILLGFVDASLGLVNEQSGMGLLGAVYSLAVLIPSLAILARRLHDIGRSGWWILLVLIPLVGSIVLLVFAVLDSTPEENQWGPSLKYREQAEAELASA